MESLLNPAILAARAAAIGEGLLPADLNLRLGVEVRDIWSYTVIFAGGRISVAEGLDCDISVHLGEETGLEIANGRINAQQAIDSGNLEISGELALLPVSKTLAALGALLGEPTDT